MASLHCAQLDIDQAVHLVHRLPRRDFAPPDAVQRVAKDSLDLRILRRRRHRDRVIEQNLSGGRQISCGLRINPGYSEVTVPLYDPAGPGSRLGVSAETFKKGLAQGRFDGLSGIHFHSLCEQDADVLVRTLDAIRSSFGEWPQGLSWINLGGGHHITHPGYDLNLLVQTIDELRAETDAVIYLEPGEAVALNAGWLVATVLDLFQSQTMMVAILDTSAACHMPDVLEMPYTPA